MGAIKLIQAKHYRRAERKRAKLIVLHSMEYPERKTAAEWCAGFFTDPRRPKLDPVTKKQLIDANGKAMTEPVTASAHFCVDSDSVVQCVERKDIAFHVPGYIAGSELNAISYGIEHHGYARQTRDEWLDAESMAALEISAELVARLCHEDNITPVFLDVEDLKAGNLDGITGHVQCTKASGKGTHWDPGLNFPWDWYIERVRSHHALLRFQVDPLRARDPAISEWPIVEHAGQRWSVAPIYITPIAIGQAHDVARAMGLALPTPGLVDAIWRAADLRIDAMKMIRRDHDGTPKTMASYEMFVSQATLLAREIGGRPYRLLAGYAKDVVNVDGVLGLYGWHRADGSVVQPFYSKHARGWLDYSQGLRLVRRAP